MPTVDPLALAGWTRLLDEEIRAANTAADRRERCLDEHGYGCARAECGRALAGDVRGLAEFLPTSDPARIVAPKEEIMSLEDLTRKRLSSKLRMMLEREHLLDRELAKRGLPSVAELLAPCAEELAAYSRGEFDGSRNPQHQDEPRGR